MTYALVQSRPSDGHIFSVRGFPGRVEAIAAVERDDEIVPQDGTKVDVVFALANFGEWADNDVRISVLEVG